MHFYHPKSFFPKLLIFYQEYGYGFYRCGNYSRLAEQHQHGPIRRQLRQGRLPNPKTGVSAKRGRHKGDGSDAGWSPQQDQQEHQETPNAIC